MSISKNNNKKILGVIGISCLAAGIPMPAIAQTLSISDLIAPDVSTTHTPELDELLISSEIETAPPSIGLTFNEETTAAHIKPQLEIEKTLAFSTIVETAPVVEESVQLQAIQPVTEAAALINPIKAETFNEIAASDEINSELAYPATTEDAVEVAQARRRTRATALGSDYIGIGADIGYADDFGFAAISKFSFSRRFAIRPSVVIGDDFSVLVPVTYDFSQYSGDMGGFPIRPYAGVGASYTNTDEDNDDNDDGDDDSDINLLLSAGVDIPISRRFTFNSQVNWGVLEESQFGITVGVGYNLGNLIGR